MSTIADQLMCRLADVPYSGCSKITIVGAGHVGMACAICILSKGISSELCLIDTDEHKVQGEILDLQHGSSFIQNARISGGTDLALSCCTRLYIIAAGVPLDPEEGSIHSLIEPNSEVIKQIVPQIVKISPRCIILVVTSPVDVMTQLAWKISGLPRHRVFGSGTTLDSARFRFAIAQRLKVAPTNCDACIIGEHGDSSVAVWSAVSVSGVTLRDIDECIGVNEDEECWHDVHNEVINAPSNVLKMKGHSNWAIGLSCAAIAEAIIGNTGAVLPVSTGIKGMYGIEKDVFLSMPCCLNANGITSVVKLTLTPFEVEQLQKSAEFLAGFQSLEEEGESEKRRSSAS